MPTSDDRETFVRELSLLIVDADQSFPLRIEISMRGADEDRLLALKLYLTKEICSWESRPRSIDISVQKKQKAEALLLHLKEHGWSFEIDYSELASHPGTVVARNVPSELPLERLKASLNDQCHFLSLLKGNYIADSRDVCLVFSNFMDAEEILRKSKTDAFRDKNGALALEWAKPQTNRDSRKPFISLENSLDSIAIENTEEFFPAPLLYDELNRILLKFALFGEIETICIPVLEKENDTVQLEKTIFIKFSTSSAAKARTLECLYFLSDLTYEELLKFTSECIHDLVDDVSPNAKPSSVAPKLRLSIVQKKHGSQLARSIASDIISYSKGAQRELVIYRKQRDAELTNQIFNVFFKANNYQETNVYVNNLPILFHNDDDLWHLFWEQFGFDGINSAKIIKPQFYSRKHTETVGKIGFVFYKEFKMALRAIIMTNNREVYYPGQPPVLVQTSFAIQKKNSSWSSPKYLHSKTTSLASNSREFPVGSAIPFTQRSVAKRASLPTINSSEYSNYTLMGPDPVHGYMCPPYDPFMFNPYYVQMPGFGMDSPQMKPPPPLSSSPQSSPRSRLGFPPMNAAYAPPYGYMMQFYSYSPLMPYMGNTMEKNDEGNSPRDTE